VGLRACCARVGRMGRRRVEIVLPDWLDRRLDTTGPLATRSERMRFVVDLARTNVRAGTGGPFAAAVVQSSSGRVVAAGVNLVVPLGNSTAHAEMVAIALAEAEVGGYDLGAGGTEHVLVCTVEPCAMCLGAIVWSGVSAVVCGGRDADARAIGFDEGPKAADWVQQLEGRGLRVERDVLRSEAVEVLHEYVQAGGVIYNAGR